jgi:cytoskeletal protein CcmA (bactofilin family)
MFSRRPDRPREEPRFSPPSGARSTDLVAAPLSPTPWAGHLGGPAPDAGSAYRREEATVVAEHDHIEGTLRSGLGVLVLGTVIGRIESDLWIRIGETAEVRADLVADEIVVAGRYEGHLVAAERLEIAPTGQLRGDIEAPRLMLHEGGFIDGQLSMTPRPAAVERPEAEPGDRIGISVEDGAASLRDGVAAASPRGTSGPTEPSAADPAPDADAGASPNGTAKAGARR